MIKGFQSRRYFPLFCIFLSVLCALLLFAIEKLNLLSVVKEVSLNDLRENKTVSITDNVYLTGECKIQLYGWTQLNPGPTDGADQYIEIQRLSATLNSVEVVTIADKYDEKRSVNEQKWTVNIPTRGLLKVTFEKYVAPRDDLLDATYYLDCERPWTRTMMLSILAVSILSGFVGLILVLRIGVKEIIRILKN